MSIADELITRGWAQGELRDGEGRVCLMGAVHFAHDRTVEGAYKRAIKALIEACPAECFVEWRDAPERTFDEVLRVAKIADEILGA